MKVRIYADAERVYHWDASVRGKPVARGRQEGYTDKGSCIRAARTLFPRANVADEVPPIPTTRPRELRNWCPPV